MFTFDLTDHLRKKINKIGKKDKVLAQNFYKKIDEVINRNTKTINSYKNLRSPMPIYRKIHLTDNYILLFTAEDNHIIFIDIKHRHNVYK